MIHMMIVCKPKTKTYIVAFLLFSIQWCIILLCCISSMKGQSSKNSIIDNHHNSLRIGRIQSIQLDSKRNLYIWINNCDIVRYDASSKLISFFHYGYSSRFRHGFQIVNDEIHIYDGELHVYDLNGNLIYEKELDTFPYDDIREIVRGNTKYIIKGNGVFDEVWEIGNNRNDCIYRRLAWDIRSQLLLSLVISILCLLPLCKKLHDIVNN